MIDNYILAPVLANLITAVVQLILWRKTRSQKYLSIAGSFFGVLLSARLFQKVYDGGILTMNAANWDAPFGIVFVADLLSAVLVLITAITALAVSIFSSVSLSRQRMLYGYFPIFHFLIMGLQGAFLTGDIFNLYVFFEVIIISSFVLMTLGGRKAQLEGAVKYMALNILASTFFLTGIGILYGITGSLNMADLAIKIKQVDNSTLVNITSIFFILGFGVKSAVFPLYFWLPSSYHTPPSAVAATFGGLLTKVGIYAMLRTFSLIFIPDTFTQNLLMGIAVFTIIVGAFGALIKTNMRMTFSYLIVCHIGFMVGGIAMFCQVALLGVVFYLMHDIILKTNLFLITGLIRHITGTMDLKTMGGLYRSYPKISLMIALVLFSLVGIPPLSGFWPKLFLFQSGFELQQNSYILALVLGSFFTLYVIVKTWSEAFWKEPPVPSLLENKFEGMNTGRKVMMILPILLLLAVSLFIGLGAQSVYVIAEKISIELVDTSPYIRAVLGRE
ncbi:MAG: proton-conducting transporter membrane subunit [Weeksellaceae bacterium]|nr:proton-conducting transporter membrane subunit [Weeksellaceae bacterium]